MKVLIVEDDQFIAEIYKQKLEAEGLEVKVIKEGLRVLEEIKNFSPDIILLDLLLPDISGMEVLNRLKAEGILEKIKVFVVSNLGTEQEKVQAFPNVDYFIKAEYTPSELLKEIKKYL